MVNNESDNSREWAAQAYALLKQKQELKKQEDQLKEEQQKEQQQKERQQEQQQKERQQEQPVIFKPFKVMVFFILSKVSSELLIKESTIKTL